MDAGEPVGMTSDVMETLRQVIVASGELTHQFGRVLTDPDFAGLVSNADFLVLTTLRLSGPQRPQALREQTGLTGGGLSNLFDRLETQQLIHRTYGESDGDRRSALVALSPRGDELVDALSDSIRRTIVAQSALVQRTCALIDAVVGPPGPPTGPPPTPLEQLQLFARLGTDLNAALADIDEREPTPGLALLVLCAAAEPEGTRPKQLVELTDLSSGGVTMLLDRVERAGLVNRAAGRQPDRRVVSVTLTDLGRHELRGRLARTAPLLPEIRAALSDPELADGRSSPRDVSGVIEAL